MRVSTAVAAVVAVAIAVLAVTMLRDVRTVDTEPETEMADEKLEMCAG